jgi:cell division protein FtsI (penicillin-binding protein 3)
MVDTNRSKIFVLFGLIVLLNLFFLIAIFRTTVMPRELPKIVISQTSKAERGHIIAKDGYHIATTKKLYKATVNTKNIDPKKRELFIKLFSIYSGIDQKKIKKKLGSKNGFVTLSYKLSPQQAKHLSRLAYELNQLNVFVDYVTKDGRSHLHSLDILESGETRLYPYNDLLTPLIGYVKKFEDDHYTRHKGVKGLEASYNDQLQTTFNGTRLGKRDVNSFIILNGQSFSKYPVNGKNIHLTIRTTIQKNVEKILDDAKKDLNAKEMMAVVMEAKTGKIITFASSNRYHPKMIKKEEYSHLNSSPIEYSFEPGSVLKPLIFAMLLEKNLVNPYDLVKTYNGRYRIGKKVITDEHRAAWMSAEDVIVNSSNIGIAQLAQKLDGKSYYAFLKEFGFTQQSSHDLLFEHLGTLPTIKQLDRPIYKATTSYGYGLQANLLQLLRTFNTFNNGGRLINPYVVDFLSDEHGKRERLKRHKPKQIISPSTAQRMKQILVKTVKKGTGQKAAVIGLEIGGKTGTAHIAKEGKYVNAYNSSFIGFANDEENEYTIAVTAIEPERNHFASSSAAPVFRRIVETMLDYELLTQTNYED